MAWINFTDFTGNSATFPGDYLVGYIGVQEQRYPVVALKNGLSAGLFTAQNLLVTEDTTIRGNLSVLGSQSVFETIVSVTSALSVINVGTGPALTVKQTGTEPIALFLDDSNNTFRIDDNFKVSFFNSHATGQYSVAEGYNNIASGFGSHAEGENNTASGGNSHAEGDNNVASGDSCHAEGQDTLASGNYSHAQGANAVASGVASHAEGYNAVTGRRNGYTTYTAATKTFTFAPSVSANFSFVSPGTVLAGYDASVLTDYFKITVASRSTITGVITATTDVIGGNSFDGYLIDNSGDYGHAEGEGTTASGYASHAEGANTAASGSSSHAEGQNTTASGDSSHAEGSLTRARGSVSHAAGYSAEAAHDRTWIWKGSTVSSIISTTRADQFMVSAAGGLFLNNAVGINTDSTANALTVNGNISGTSGLIVNTLTGRNISLVHTPANDGENSYIQLGEFTTGSTTASAFSGFRFEYNEPTNSLCLSSIMGLSSENILDIYAFNGISINQVTRTRELSVIKTTAGSDAAITILAGNTIGDAASLFFGHEAGQSRGQIRYYNGGVEAMAFSTATLEAMRIRANGNVGIGTTSPGEKLTVVGNISATGSLIVNPLTARNISIVHTPANDGTNPFIQLGEFTTGSTTASAFSGYRLEYNENTNAFNLSSIFGAATTDVININNSGNVTANSVTVRGTLSASGNVTGNQADFTNTTIRGTLSANGNVTVMGTISGNSNLSVSNNFITGPRSRVVGSTSSAENTSIVVGDNSHAEGFYSGVLGNGSHAEGTASYAGLRCIYSSYNAATRTLSFTPTVSARIDNYATYAAGTSAILYSTTPVRFEPVVIESRDPVNGSIILTADVVGANISSGTRFLVLPGNFGANLYSHAEGYYAEATGAYSHAEGNDCWAHGQGAHAEGSNTVAEGICSHAEGSLTTASGFVSHAEGINTIASGYASHAEGVNTIASNSYSHAQGYNNVASGQFSHAAGAYAAAAHGRTWIWHGSTATDIISTTRTGQFMVSASGGLFLNNAVGINTDSVANALTVNGIISGNDSLFVNAITGRNISLVHTPANDGENSYIQLGEFTTGSTTASAFSGFRFEYNELNNVLSLSSILGNTITNVLNVEPYTSVTPYTVTFTPFSSAGIGTGAGGTIIYPPALSGIIPSSELSSRFLNNKGAIDGVLFFANDGVVNAKQYTLEFAKDAAFTLQKTSIYLRTGGETANSIMRPINGSFVNGRIVMPSANATQPYGASGALIEYPYTAGDSIFYRIGFAYPTVSETMALSAGYIRILP